MRHSFLAGVVICALAACATAQSSNGPAVSDPAGVPAYQPSTTNQEQELKRNLKDVHFAFDRFELTPEDRSSLQQTADWLKANPGVYVTIAGDADERGSIVYNVYLSDERAKATRDTLVSMGVPEGQIVFATGWGKLYPVCRESDESCWARNRRAHFEPWRAGSLAAFDFLRPSATELAVTQDLKK